MNLNSVRAQGARSPTRTTRVPSITELDHTQQQEGATTGNKKATTDTTKQDVPPPNDTPGPQGGILLLQLKTVSHPMIFQIFSIF